MKFLKKHISDFTPAHLPWLWTPSRSWECEWVTRDRNHLWTAPLPPCWFWLRVPRSKRRTSLGEVHKDGKPFEILFISRWASRAEGQQLLCSSGLVQQACLLNGLRDPDFTAPGTQSWRRVSSSLCGLPGLRLGLESSSFEWLPRQQGNIGLPQRKQVKQDSLSGQFSG